MSTDSPIISTEILEKLNEAFAISAENPFIADVKAKFDKTGTLSEKQITAVLRAKDRFDIEYVSPTYNIGDRVKIIGKVVRIEPVVREVAYHQMAEMTRYVISDDMGMLFYITTAAKRLTAILNLMDATKEEFSVDGIVQWRPDNAKMPIIMSKKGLMLNIIEDTGNGI